MKRSGGLMYPAWQTIRSHERNEALDVLVYALVAARSCLSNDDEKAFWANLRGETEKKARPKTVRQRQLDLFSD